MDTKIMAIVGPTAVGKTSLSLALAEHYNGEIISGDSMQVYKQLTIGTAKIQKHEMNGIPHHLIDFLSPDSLYNASDFKQLAQVEIDNITNRHHLPMIVGGTGLYIEGLINNLSFGGENSHQQIVRERLEKKLEEKGVDALYEELCQKDKQAASSIHKHNPRRIIRALEVIETTGSLYSMQKNKKPYNTLLIGLTLEREKLYKKINERVDIMLKQGLLEEAKWLYDQPYRLSAQSAKAIGYKEFFPYFDGNITLEEAVELLKRNSRRYAKRQLTWFNNRLNVKWFDMEKDSVDTVRKEIDAWLNK